MGRSKKAKSFLLSSITALGMVVAGYLSGYSSPVIPVLEADHGKLHLDSMSAMMFGSIQCFSALLGCPIALVLMEKFGRKPALIVSAPINVLGWTLLAAAVSVPMLMCSRFLLGISMAMVYQVMPVYIGETASDSVRGLFVSLSGAAYFSGRLLVLVLAYPLNWRYLAAVMSGVCVIQFFLLFFIPESPRWLVQKGNTEKALKSLFWLRADQKRVDRELQVIIKSCSKRGTVKLNWATISKKAFYKPMIWIFVVQSLVAFSGFGPLLLYTQSILVESGFKQAFLGSIILTALQVLVSILSNLVIDRFGRKILMSFSAIGTAVAVFAFGCHFLVEHLGLYPIVIHNSGGVQTAYIEFPQNLIPLICLVFWFISSAIAMLNVNFLICSEISPVEYQGFASWLSVSMSYGTMGLLALTFNATVETFTKYGTFFFYGGVQTVLLVLFMIFVPETRGGLENIGKMWEQGVPFCNWSPAGSNFADESVQPLLSFSVSQVVTPEEARRKAQSIQKVYGRGAVPKHIQALSSTPATGSRLPTMPERPTLS